MCKCANFRCADDLQSFSPPSQASTLDSLALAASTLPYIRERGRSRSYFIQAWTLERAKGKWTVKEVLFKGFYEDLILENNGAILRVVNDESGKYAEGDIVGLKIKKWLEY